MRLIFARRSLSAFFFNPSDGDIQVTHIGSEVVAGILYDTPFVIFLS